MNQKRSWAKEAGRTPGDRGPAGRGPARGSRRGRVGAAPPRSGRARPGDGRLLEESRERQLDVEAVVDAADEPRWPAASGRRGRRSRRARRSRSTPSSSAQIRRAPPRVGLRGATYSTAARRPRACGRAAPCGRPCRWASAAARRASRRPSGTMYSGSVCPGTAPQLGRGRQSRPFGERRRPTSAFSPVRSACVSPTAASRTAGCWRQQRLDLAQLDAEAADLDLVVDAAEELERAVGDASAPGRRCGTGAPPARRRTGSGTNRSAVSSGRSAVAAREAGAADVELAGHADRHRRAAARRGRRRACWRSAGRSATGLSPARPVQRRRPDRRLGRAVDVPQRGAAAASSRSPARAGSASPPQSDRQPPACPSSRRRAAAARSAGVACMDGDAGARRASRGEAAPSAAASRADQHAAARRRSAAGTARGRRCRTTAW